MNKKAFRAFVDRIEGDVAVLIFEEDSRPVNIPVCYLPNNVEESTVVAVYFEVDPEATIEAKERIKGLIKKLQRKDS